MSGTINLTEGNDTWPTTQDNTGNDTVNGLGGNDSIDGGSGNDYLYGGNNDDTLIGGAGDDWLEGSGGANLLLGGADQDTLIAVNWDETNVSTLNGGAGNDSLVSTGGKNLLLGGDGNDRLLNTGYSNGGITLNGGGGDDYIVAGGGKVDLLGGAGNDTFTGFTGGGSTYYVNGGSGVSLAVFTEDFALSNLSLADGSIDGRPYQATYTLANGSKVYFAEFNGGALTGGGLQFNNELVELDVVCFAEGTMIMTPTGEQAIESLRAGDLVVTASGHGASFKPVRWVGRRTVDLTAHPDPEKATPILVTPGALGTGIPHRALRVSPEHALLVDDALIPARLLVDGETIVRVPAKGSVTYYHVELEAHDILLAEGAPTESYIDLGNRGAFDNSGVIQMLHADFTPQHEGGMPRITEGPALERARRVVAQRREAMLDEQRIAS